MWTWTPTWNRTRDINRVFGIFSIERPGISTRPPCFRHGATIACNGYMNIEDFMNMRGAGILAHITSLPGSPFIGDLGAAAHEFVEFLNSAGQAVWQLLPLQPTEAGQGN